MGTPLSFGAAKLGTPKNRCPFGINVDNFNERRRTVAVQSVECRILYSVTPTPSIDLVAASSLSPPLSLVETGEAISDPLGLTSQNTDDPNDARVFIIDSSNPNAITEFASLSRTDVTASMPLASVDILSQPNFLRDGDTIYIRDGDYTIDSAIRIERDNVTFAAYPQEGNVILRHGSFVYDWAMRVNGNDFTMRDIDFVGHINTPDGKLYSQLLLRIGGDNASIENNNFRHNANYLDNSAGDGDIAFGKRVNLRGEVLPAPQQLWGRTVLFDSSENSLFRNNVVVPFEGYVVEREWNKDLHNIEGLMTDSSTVLVENNQFGSAGHQMISSRFSTLHIRNNTFGDASAHAHLLGIEVSEHVQILTTHTALGVYINDGTIVEGNIFSHNTADPNDSGNGIQVQSSSNSDIFNNLFVDAGGAGHGIAVGYNRYSSVEEEAANNNIHHNTFVNIPNPISLGYFHGVVPEDGDAVRDNHIFNNVITFSDEAKTSPYWTSNVPIRLNLGDPIGGNGNTITGNLIFDSDANLAAKSVRRTASGVDELTIDEFNQLSFVNNNSWLDPRFAHERTSDFRIYIGSAFPVSNGIVRDFFGIEREAASLGAFTSFSTHAPSSAGTTIRETYSLAHPKLESWGVRKEMSARQALTINLRRHEESQDNEEETDIALQLNSTAALSEIPLTDL